MPHQRSELASKYHLKEEDVELTLLACRLPGERAVFSDDEIKSFEAIREFFNSGACSDYSQAAELFKKGRNGTKDPKSAESSKRQSKSAHSEEASTTSDPKDSPEPAPSPTEETLDFTDFLARAKEQLGIRITLKQGVQVLSVCGLSDKELYTQQECDRFIGACAVLTQNGQVSIEDSIIAAASASESGLVSMIDRSTLERVKNLPGLVNQLYLKNAAQVLNDSAEDIQEFWAEMEARILAGIEGKSIIPQILGQEWKPNFVNASSLKPMKSADASEPSTNTESPEELKGN